MARSSSLLNLLLGIWVALLCSLSLSVPLQSDDNSHLFKRDDSLYKIWNSIPGAQKATGYSALPFRIDQSVDNAWGITYLHGCTGLMISDPDFVIVAHMLEETATGKICINDPTTLNNWLANTLQPALDLYPPTGFTEVGLIYNEYNCAWTGTGVKSIITWLTNTDNWGVDEENIRALPYSGGSGTGEPQPDQPWRLAAVRWLKPQLEGFTKGTLQMFFNSDTPIRDQVFVNPP